MQCVNVTVRSKGKIHMASYFSLLRESNYKLKEKTNISVLTNMSSK